MHRPKTSSSRLGAGRSVTTSSTTPLGRRSSSAKRGEEQKLPSMKAINREISDKSAELLGRSGMEPRELVDWIQGKRGQLCCIYMKFSEDKASPSWQPYKYQVTDSTVMRSKQIFFTLSPDGLTQFSLDSTVFIDLTR